MYIMINVYYFQTRYTHILLLCIAKHKQIRNLSRSVSTSINLEENQPQTEYPTPIGCFLVPRTQVTFLVGLRPDESVTPPTKSVHCVTDLLFYCLYHVFLPSRFFLLSIVFLVHLKNINKNSDTCHPSVL